MIIAAYISPANTANVRLANALIFASGGYPLELGEPDAMLAHPYFPNFDIMDEAQQAVMRRYYDFLVRYENVLALNTRDAAAKSVHSAVRHAPRSARLCRLTRCR